MQQKSQTDKNVEFRDGIFGQGVFSQVSVPQSDCLLQAELAHQKAVHPSKRELNEIQA